MKPAIQHLACIMDGNRRWARKCGRMPSYGHKEGVETVKRVIQFCFDNQISYLSLYTFSIENFKRSPEEVGYLFQLLAQSVQEGLPEFLQRGIRIRFVGDRSLFPAELMRVCADVEEKTAMMNTLTLNFLFCYGSQQEIISGVKAIIAQIKKGLLNEQDITCESFNDFLWTNGIPAPDLIIRTGGVKRLSNFMLYQSAYSEFYFLDCLWPELSTHDLQQAVNFFNNCQRNVGV